MQQRGGLSRGLKGLEEGSWKRAGWAELVAGPIWATKSIIEHWIITQTLSPYKSTEVLIDVND